MVMESYLKYLLNGEYMFTQLTYHVPLLLTNLFILGILFELILLVYYFYT
jgi:hypothetical protein